MCDTRRRFDDDKAEERGRLSQDCNEFSWASAWFTFVISSRFKFIKFIMLSPLKPSEDEPYLIQTYNSSGLALSSTYEYPTKAYFLTTPSISDRKYEQMKDDLSRFQFSVFDVSQAKSKELSYSRTMKDAEGEEEKVQIYVKKPEPFMGAFLQTQKQFDCFKLNVKIPSLREVMPFSRILSQSIIIQKPEKKPELLPEVEDQSRFLQSDQSESHPQNLSLQISNIDQANDVSHSFDLSHILMNYNEEEQEQRHRKLMRERMWEEDDSVDRFSHAYEFHISKCNEFIQRVQSVILLSERTVRYSQADITSSLVKMILGVESDLFVLEYHTLTWRFTGIPAKFDFILRTSFQLQLEDVLEIANCKSRLETALNHIKKESYRRILQEVGIETRQFMIILQQIALEITARNGSYLDFVMTIAEYKAQVLLVYELIINQSWVKNQNKSYMDFDVSFLNSEAVMFRQIIRISNTNDTLMGKGYELCLKLLRAAFKPITFTLNRLVFQEVIEISNRDDTYLRFYFENLKDLLSYLGKRIDLIKQDSNQLYMICRIKDEIKIVMETSQLSEYIETWNHIFNNKKKLIDQVQKREKKRVKEAKQKKEQDKIKQIYQLRARLLKSIEQTKQRKSEIYLQGVKEIERLKKDIQQREERRRLNYLIEKEQQKGFLLEAELKEKRKLIHIKEELVAKAQQEGIELMTKFLKEEKIVNLEQTKSEKRIEKEIKKQEADRKLQKIEREEATMKKQEKIPVTSMQKMNSNTSNISIPSQQKLQSESDPENSETNSIDLPNPQPIPSSDPSQNDIHVSTNTVLELCIDNIIKQQIEITNLALSHLVYDKYQLLNIMEFMRKIFLNGNGEANNNFLHLSVSHDSKINVEYFNQCSLFDYGDQFVRQLGPEFYEVHGQSVMHSENQIMRRGAGIYQNRQINLFQESIDISIGFQFSKLPILLQPYFSYIHLSKYMQIFSHILKIRHCNNLVSQCLLSLNEYKDFQQNPANRNFLKKLYLTRHMIHIYLNTLQSYLFHRVIQKQLKVLRTKLKNKDINELAVVHLNMLDFIIRKGLIQNSLNDISKRIKGLLMEIRKFKNIVDSFCANDIHSYVRNQIQGQVGNMHKIFKEEQMVLESLFYHP